MRGLKAYGLIIGLVVVFYLLIEFIAPRSVSWDPSFKVNDKNPYGNYVFYHQLNQLFPESDIRLNHDNYYQLWSQDTTHNHTLIIICDYHSTDEEAYNALIKYVREGNTVFLSAANIGWQLRKDLGIKVGRNYFDNPYHEVNCRLTEKPATGFYHWRRSLKYEEIDSANYPVKILGKASGPNFLRFQIGKGYLYLHGAPLVFTNYPLLRKQTDRYVEFVMSYLPDQDIIYDVSQFDSFYNDPAERREIKELLKDPHMKWAYYLALFLLISFVFVRVKRRQRAIPVIEPPRNDSLALVGSVTQLYLQNENHKAIADKMIRHLFDYIQSRYYMSNRKLDRAYMEKLSRKSGHPIEDIQRMIKLVEQIRSASSIDADILLQLNSYIEKFKKARK